MADTTDRFSLDTYAQGDENWDHTDTVQFLDESAIEVDTIANRPTSGDYDDELFFARDQRILWRWDANSTDWEAVSGLGVDGDPVPGTSHFEALETNELQRSSGWQDSQTPLYNPIFEDFEQQDLSYYSGNTDSFEIETTTVKQGSAAAKLMESESSGFKTVQSPFEIVRGLKIRSLIFVEDSGGSDNRDADIGLSVDENTDMFSSGSGYQFGVRAEDNIIRIGENNSGTFTQLANESVTVPKEEWLILDIGFDFDELTLDVFKTDGSQVGSGISAVDDTHQSSRFFVQLQAVARNSGDGVIFDNMQRSTL